MIKCMLIGRLPLSTVQAWYLYCLHFRTWLCSCICPILCQL